MRASHKVGAGLGAGFVLLLLVVPASATGPLWSVSFTAPFTGFTVHPDRSAAVSGCAGTSYGRELVKPVFNATNGVLSMGTVSATGCKTNTGNATANSSELVFVRSASFSPATTGNYWVNVTLNLSFTFTFTSNSFGVSSYQIRASVTLVDLNTNGSRVVGPHYFNGTTSGGCCGAPLSYRGILVPFSGHLRLVNTDSYVVRIKLTESVFSTASGSTGRSKTSLLLSGFGSAPSTLQSITVQ